MKSILDDVLFARAYFLLGLFFYMLGGYYLDLLDLKPIYDPILEKIPIVNVGAIVTYGLVFIYGMAFIYLKPLLGGKKETEFWIILSSSFIIRTFFCLITAFGVPSGFFPMEEKGLYFLLKKARLVFQNDLFFSGHTAAPFGFFLFFDDKTAKIIFLIGTVVMGISMLLLHHHYVVDVLAAPVFIWAIYSFFHYRFFKQRY